MSKYSSGNVTLHAPAEKVYAKLSNLENLRSMLDQVPADRIPEDKRHMFENLKITQDSIEVPGGPMGSLTFRVVERKEPSLIKLQGEGVPMKMELLLHLKPKGGDETEAKVDLDIDLPLMLRPLVGGQIQKVAEQFGSVLGSIPFA